MSKKTPFHYITLTKNFITSVSSKIKYRMHEKDFTRNRKITFSELSLCMLRLLRQNIQVEIIHLLESFKKRVGGFTSSAFVQSRSKLKPDMFYDLNRLIAEDFYEDNDEVVELYKGHRVLGIDGSTINVPVNKETKEMYGTFSNQKQNQDIVLARVSIMYDVLNDIVLDGRLCNFSIGEVTLSREHIKLAKSNDLIIMDRSYPSFESMYEMNRRDINFLFRCKVNFSNVVKAFYESKQQEIILDISPNKNDSFKDLPYDKHASIRVRLIRIELSSGEIEILMTSLLNDTIYLYADFEKLYFKRWRIETFYNRFKNIICLENFSGTSCQFIQQEFNCALYMSTLQSILSHEAQEEVDTKHEARKYEYKINSSLSLSFIRSRLLELFKGKAEGTAAMNELKQLFTRNLIPIRPHRTFDRNPDKYRARSKPKQFPNRRMVL